ncbi:hypothetical protein ACFL18_01310 [Patescibacteria group bacterium]
MTEIKPINLSSDDPSSVKPKVRTTVQPMAKPLSASIPSSNGSKKKMISMFVVLAVLGVATGFGLSRMGGVDAPKKLKSSVEEGAEVGDTFGVMDEKAFTDEAEGEIASGGIDGEGSHHLIREGGESQYVYLTSSIIDLDQFVGKKVKVWGQTFEGQTAGWLMDVGRLEIK